MQRLSIMIGAPAGAGIKTAGTVLARAFSRAGLHVFTNTEYPSIIRGENNSCQVTVGDEQIHSHNRSIDVLMALDKLTYDMHKQSVADNGIIVYDTGKFEPDPEHSDICFPVPLSDIVRDAGERPQLTNVAGLTAILSLIGFELDYLKGSLRHTLGDRHQDKVPGNIKVIDAVYQYVHEHYSDKVSKRVIPEKDTDRMLINGNEAVVLGAVRAGIKFYAGYPMTPATSIMTDLARLSRRYGIVVVQAEDEISAANMVVGAAHAGCRAMVATSGGGFCLMTEAFGLAGMTETPIVMVESQRPGPSTGLPTRTAQGDLHFILNASQGEFPRIVIAPGTVEECFNLTFHAFNIAEQLQTPVIILLDKHISECQITHEPFPQNQLIIDRGALISWDIDASEEYHRYLNTPSGVSPRALPGAPGHMYCATSDEHDEKGDISEEENPVVTQYAKRMRKLNTDFAEIPKLKVDGDKDSDITFVTWGSLHGAVIEAMDLLRSEGISTQLIRPILMNPFPAEEISKALENNKLILNIEQNYTGQMAALIRQQTGIVMDGSITKYSGRQLFPDEIVEQAKTFL